MSIKNTRFYEEVEDRIVDYLNDSTIEASMPLYNLMIDDYKVGIMNMGSSKLLDFHRTHSLIDEKFFNEIEWMIKNRDLQSFEDRYRDTTRGYSEIGYSFRKYNGYYRMTIASGVIGQTIVIDIYSFKIRSDRVLPLWSDSSSTVSVNMDYVKINANSTYTYFTIKGVKYITGSELINYLEDLDVGFKIYLMKDLIKVELDEPIYDDNGDDFREFTMDYTVTADNLDFIKFGY